ncbi:MAG: T9SS type A sorting domain-containing protein [Bacteroidota bacterium]
MQTLKKALSITFILASVVGFAQTSINQDVSMENGKIRIQVTKEENGKKEIFDQTYNAEGMSPTEKQALIDRVTDSLTAGSGKNMKMRIKVDRDRDDHFNIHKDKNGNHDKKRITIKKDGKTIINGDEDLDLDLDFDIDIDDHDFNFNGKDFDMKDFENKIGDLGKTLQFKFDELGPKMRKFGEDMEPHFRKFADADYFKFESANNSKSVKNLTAYPNKPSNNKLNVKFMVPEKGNVTITVTDINGKEIGKEKIADFSGEYFGQVDLKGNVKGTVFVTVVQGEDGTVKRVVLND